ncbi:MAG TPA: TetR/AcrR family transcriptional regulator [Clostridiales bacterium]|jgi:AcrR family transcriptional regulator|nr:TetR-like C-terminal domain-containing protein [Eubacteriales bacterium]HBR30711.1 TetR/AcrR family transcriptional regulator [Clostridiales bacterium]
MITKKDDRRVKYTKMVLKDSFITLLEKKDISKISITEICENADINRATFYAHYNDQYDFMNQIQDELLGNVENHLAAFSKNDLPIAIVDMVEQIFEYIKENARICKLLLSDRGDLNFQKRVFMLVYENIINNIVWNDSISKEDAEYIHAFTLTGCIGVIQKWLNDDMKKSPRFMAATILKLTSEYQDLYRNSKTDV